MSHRPFTRFIALLLAGLTLSTGVQVSTARAALVSTQVVIQQESIRHDQDSLLALTRQEQAVQALHQLGVDPALVQERIRQMTASELQAFNDQVNQMEAGGSALGIIVFLLLLLILLDLLGVTDVFPSIRPL